MKVKNLCQHHTANICAQMALELHNVDIEWVDSGPVDLLLLDAFFNYDDVKDISASLKLCFDLQHVSDNKHRCWSNVGWTIYKDSDIHAIIECEDPGFNSSQILFYDFLWNRSKAYYTNRTWNIQNPWYYAGETSYLLQPVSSAEQKTRLFLSPNRLTRPNIVYRSHLTDVIRRKDVEHLGYYSCFQFTSDSTKGLYPNRKSPGIQKIADMNPALSSDFFQGFDPVHNAYYNETFFSVYVETIETGTTQCVTEKTLDPLIKGHFILPFSCAGFIKYLKNQGWRFPDFIDYRYDSISDDEIRFRVFKEEFLRLCSISMDDWRQLWLDNIDIIEYNRNQLYNRPYHYLEVLKNVNST